MKNTSQTQPQTPAEELAALIAQRAALGAENSRLAQLENELTPQLQENQTALIAGDADALTASAGVSLRLNAVALRRAEIAEAAPALDARLHELHEAAQRAATEARALDLRTILPDEVRTERKPPEGGLRGAKQEARRAFLVDFIQRNGMKSARALKSALAQEGLDASVSTFNATE